MPEIISNKKALLAGATGLVGSHLLTLLLNDPYYAEVIIPVRRKTGINNPKLTEIIIDFDKLDSYKDLLKADDIFCCLGTTIKKAGSQEAFRKVDFNYPLELANVTLKNGARQFLIITSIGANEKSKVFYTRVKGEIENELTKLNFKSISIFRPSMILGERKEKRFNEKAVKILFKIISPLLAGSLKKYRGIEAADIAKAMLISAKEFHAGISIYESDIIKSIAG